VSFSCFYFHYDIYSLNILIKPTKNMFFI